MRSVHLLYITFLLLRFFAAEAAFTCNATTRSTCQALVGYVPANATTYAAIKSLFQVKSIRSLFGANGLPLSTTAFASVPAGSTVRVPFPCKCSNRTGFSNRRPVYTVKPGDGLDAIARDTFTGLVTYEEIAAINNISDPNLIQVGQELWVPLPCSCDEVDGEDVVHYGHVVVPGSSVLEIAVEFGITEETLLRLNGIVDPNSLQAGQILDVPLQACSSSISSKSLDRGLHVPSGSYALTAKNCILCSCNSSSWQLNCRPIQGLNRSVCPAATCGSVNIGNNISSNSICELTTCAYAGYTNDAVFTILTNITTQSLCNNTGVPVSQPSGNYASRLGLQGSNWTKLLVFLHMTLLCFGFMWHETG